MLGDHQLEIESDEKLILYDHGTEWAAVDAP